VLGVAVAVLALDIVSKTIVVKTLTDGRTIRLLGGLLTLLESRNPGAAFSLGGPSETIVFTAIAAGVVIFIIRAARRIQSLAWAVALGLLLGGATGNLTDRIFRAPGPFRGWVVDWIELPHWPVFNLADSAITCGGVLMVLLALLGHGIDGAMHTARDHADPEPTSASAVPSGEAQPDSDQSGPAGSQQPRQENPTGRS
jgi:signal peptidase II